MIIKIVRIKTLKQDITSPMLFDYLSDEVIECFKDLKCDKWAIPNYIYTSRKLRYLKEDLKAVKKWTK